MNGVIAFLMIASPVGEATVAAVTLCTFASSGVMSIDGPARSASMPSIVGMENLASAMGLSMVITQVTMPISLSMVGVLNGSSIPDRSMRGRCLCGPASSR